MKSIKKSSNIITKLFLIIGLALIALPFILKMISAFNQTTVISHYTDEVSQMQQNDINSLQETASNFNEQLYKDNSFDSSLTQDNISSIDLSGLDILAYITIPKINVDLPIYEGYSDKVLSLGIGHLSNTSLPSGGINTHCVLVGHTGLSNATLFDDLDKLVLGDRFSINFLGNTLDYEVNNIQVVTPSETDSLIIHKNEDLVTLITCTPRHVNTHRLLVTGSRVYPNETNSYNDTETDVDSFDDNIVNNDAYNYYAYNSSHVHDIITIVINVSFILLFLIFFVYFIRLSSHKL